VAGRHYRRRPGRYGSTFRTAIATSTIAIAIMIESKPLVLSAQSTIHKHSPAVAVRISPIDGMLTAGAAQRRRVLRHKPGDSPYRVRLLGDCAYETAPDDHPVGTRVSRGRHLLRGGDPKAERNRS
jgi:hypothetical protein